MKSIGAELLTCLAVLAVAAPAANEANETAAPPPQAAAADPLAAIPGLLAELAHEDYATREAATRKLWEIGDPAIPALKEAAEGTDPEIAYRARDILRKLDLFIAPGTDPAVIALIERYKKAANSQKLALLAQLREKRAYRQILKLYAAETDPKLRSSLKSAVEGLSVFAAREAILAGNLVEARTMLELAPADDAGLVTLAAFHRAAGTLAAELERAKASDAPGALAWQLALYRAAGDVTKARETATAAGKPGITATMAMLEGDPLPWLEFGTSKANAAVDLYTPLAIKRWSGRALAKPDLAAIANRLNSRSTSSRQLAFGAAYLLGEPSLAEPYLSKLDPLAAFANFDSEERIDEALKAIGLDPAKPDYTKWAATRFAQLMRDPDEADDAVSELAAIASFMENRGLESELEEAFDEPLTKLADKDIDAFAAVAGAMCGRGISRGGATTPLLRMAPAWAGDDDDRWEQILVAIYGDNDEILPAWSFLSQVHPQASRQERFRGLFALSGFGPDPDDIRGQWLDRIWKHLEQGDPAQRLNLLKHVEFLLGPLPDVANQIKIIDIRTKDQAPDKPAPDPDPDEDAGLPGIDDEDPFADEDDGLVVPNRFDVGASRDMLYYAAVNRWDEAAALAVKLLAGNKGRANTRADLHAYAAACLRRAGKEAQAAEHDAWVEKLALGDASLYLRIAGGYIFGEDYARSSLWQQRAACEVAPESPMFTNVLSTYATDQLKSAKWPQAAATSEVLAQIYSRSPYGNSIQLIFLRVRQQADLARALSLLKSDRDRAVAILKRSHALSPCDGSLADYFFPSVRGTGLVEEHDQWFATSWQQVQQVIKRFPKCHNSRNNAAWLASRAARQLETAETQLMEVLTKFPRQAAYLDTMAEIQFARGRREEALKWSEKSINAMPTDAAIRRQHHRFKYDPLPK